jgi:glycosyltransferase involved in cell wall biosynthesis
MRDREASVLYVLPYPGGGGETYVNWLERMEGYRFEKTYIVPGPTHIPAVVAGGVHVQLGSRRSDLLHVQGEAAAMLCLPSLALRPSVVTIHGLHLVRRLEGWKRVLAEANLRLIVRAASKTICVGDAEYADVESLVGGTDRLVLVRNGIDPLAPTTAEERTTARAALGIPNPTTVCLYLAALDPHKEPMLVARAAEEVAAKGVPLVLLFVGDGPLRGELEALARDTEVIRILGFQSDIRRVLAAADIFVLPSRHEGLSFALLEAMSLGLTPVVSDGPGNPDAVGDAGIVVQRGNVEGFRAAFERLALDEAERQRLGEQARRRVIERFGSDKMIERTRQVYDDVLGRTP